MPHRTPFVKVPLTQGKVALVSPEDAERVLKYRWHANLNKRTHPVCWRAKRSVIVNGGRVGDIYLHRYILGLGPDDPMVDHKNGNGLDCRRGNLRVATKSQNTQNARKRTGLPYRGIRKDYNRWKARIQVNSHNHYLGSFATPEEAARAYDAAARQFFGEFACVNFPSEGERRAW